jgi:hypothetical protein
MNVRIGRVRENRKLIKTNPAVSVSHRNCYGCINARSDSPFIHDYKVVSQPMHLHEGQN